jgi:hypothetical protein
MYLRSAPILCIVFVLLFAAPVLSSAPHPFRPGDKAYRPVHAQVASIRSLPESEERSPERTLVMRTRTIRAVLRELLPEISLIAVLPVPIAGPAAFLASSRRSGPDPCSGPADGSHILFSGLSPPVRS